MRDRTTYKEKEDHTGFLVKLIKPSDNRTRPMKLYEPQAASNRSGVYGERERQMPHRDKKKEAHLARDHDI